MTQETLSHIEQVFSLHGSDAWWEMSVEELLPEKMRSMADKFTKGSDTMDVWFDSGTSWSGQAHFTPEKHNSSRTLTQEDTILPGL